MTSESVCALSGLQKIGGLFRVYSCLLPNACWDRLRHPLRPCPRISGYR
uniref:Uncharacterized protein n=1 Tax=Anguilla anguilla TaxID=7936 RepID=A0A0E9TAN5_ANGAN